MDLQERIYDIWVCTNCMSLLNATDLRNIEEGNYDQDLQRDSSDDFYAVDKDFLLSVPEEIDRCGIVNFLFEQCPEQCCDVCLDFGAGRGILSGAAARHFKKVYAAELTLNVLSQVHEYIPNKDRIALTADYAAVSEKFDCVLAMHVFEHLPDVVGTVRAIVDKMNINGSLFFQVPMLKREHLVRVHYTFFNEASIRSLCAQVGLEVVGIYYDHNLEFISCIARKCV